MCPSYRATRDEVHSTRGRAKVLAEMFQADLTPASWRNPEVHEALDLCLSCKACASDCPTKVDMATYKSEFYSHYYKGRLRPAAMYAMGLLPWAARAATAGPAAARFTNATLRAPLLGPALKRVAGITRRRPAPLFAPGGGFRRSSKRDLPQVRDRAPGESSVVIWPDTFTDAFSPEDGADLVEAFSAMGERVAVPSAWACCGRTLYDFGMLDRAKKTLGRLVTVLEPWARAGVPVVVPEPSCLVAFRDELPALLPDDPRAAQLASLARSPSEHIVAAGLLERLHNNSPGRPGRAFVHPHCHQRSVVGTSADVAVLGALGYEVEVLDAGCCGLAGSFGFNARHEPVSRKIGEDLWLPKLRDALRTDGSGGDDATCLVIDGFSCRTQLENLGPDLLRRATTLPALLRRYSGASAAC
jgi:Fe-S oxidoreductase